MKRPAAISLLVLPLLAGCYVKSEPEPSPTRSTGNASASGDPSSSTGGTTSSGGTSAGGNGTSSGGTTGTGTGTTSTLRVFVTSTTYSGNLGGAAGADAHCQTVADAKALGGTWVAWVADGAVGPLARLTAVGPWSDVRGNEVFKNRANLVTIPESMMLDEAGNYQSWRGYSTPWTGLDQEGKPTGQDCGGWTSSAYNQIASTGSADEKQDWGGATGAQLSCDNKSALVCFEN